MAQLKSILKSYYLFLRNKNLKLTSFDPLDISSFYIWLPEFSELILKELWNCRGEKRILSIISKFWKRGANSTEVTWWSLRKLNCRSREYGSPIGVSIDCIGCHESGYDRKRAKWRTKLARRAAIEEEEPITVQFMKRKIKFCWSELAEWHRNVSYVRNIHTYRPWRIFGNWSDASQIKQFLE